MCEDIDKYRFGTGKEPTDEMLAQIMHEAAVEAKMRNEEANRRYFEELQKGIAEMQEKWADRIYEVLKHTRNNK